MGKSHSEMVMAENKPDHAQYDRFFEDSENFTGWDIFANVLMHKLSDCIALAMGPDPAATGSYMENYFNWETFGLNYLELSGKSQLIPRIPLEDTFARYEYSCEYLTVLEEMEYDPGPSSWGINPTHWPSGSK